MAPRGGSHSSGGTGGSSSSSSGDSGSGGGSSSIWLASTLLYGSGFADGYVIADIVFTGLYLLALCVVSFFAMGSGKRSEAGHSVLGWKKYGIAISLMLIYYAFSFAQRIIRANGGSIEFVYFLLADIFDDVSYPATTWLLLTTYSLLFHCCNISDSTKRSRYRGFFKAHVVLCIFTIILWILILSFHLVNTATAVNDHAIEPDLIYNSWSARLAADLDMTFQTVLFVASLEILIFACWLPSKARQHGQESSAASLHFLRLVAIPFFIFRIFYLAYAAAFGLPGEPYESWGAYIVFSIIPGACIVITFAGIVVVSRRLERIQLWQHPAGQVLPQPAFAYLPTAPGQTGQAVPHYSYGPVNPVMVPQTYSQELHGHGQGVQEMPIYHVHHEKP